MGERATQLLEDVVCGIAGIFDFQAASPGAVIAERLKRMRDALAHRGPDDAGIWLDEDAGVGLGHRRLSIVDLSPLGHQPMASASGRFVVTFNGEIYNFPELRRELEAVGAHFRSRSDTEVLLEAVEKWGVPRALERFNGMFALALWDRHDRNLVLARDRFGEKPLYYGLANQVLLFGSELKALRAYPQFPARVDRAALCQFMRFQYVPAPRSIYAHIRKLPPASWICIRSASDVQNEPARYWSMRAVAERGLSHRFAGADTSAVEELDRALRLSTRMRMVSDVPLGAFLSGGIDSSTVVALMQAESSRPVRTFTIGFHDSAYNEAPYAAAVAKHLGTAHTELYVTPEDAQAVIPRLPTLYDEPFADSSQVPTFLVSELARRHVTVALSGDGGDELFGGYNRYYWADTLWRAFRLVPASLRRLASTLVLKSAPTKILRHLEGRRWLQAVLHHRTPADKLQKLAEALPATDEDELYRHLVSTWKNPNDLVRDGLEPTVSEAFHANGIEEFSERMMYTDSLTYLPDDILTKVDRASMGVSLECRVPILDPAVAEFAWSLPLKMRVHEGSGKPLLKAVLARYVPRSLFERPKTGFGLPLDSWLRGPLREWAEGLLATDRLQRDGFFRPEPIRLKWAEHLKGAHNWQYHLWPVLMFNSWHQAYA